MTGATCGYPCVACAGCCAWIVGYYRDPERGDTVKLRCHTCEAVFLADL